MQVVNWAVEDGIIEKFAVRAPGQKVFSARNPLPVHAEDILAYERLHITNHFDLIKTQFNVEFLRRVVDDLRLVLVGEAASALAEARVVVVVAGALADLLVLFVLVAVLNTRQAPVIELVRAPIRVAFCVVFEDWRRLPRLLIVYLFGQTATAAIIVARFPLEAAAFPDQLKVVICQVG